MSTVALLSFKVTDSDGDSFVIEELEDAEGRFLTLNVEGSRARNIDQTDARELAAFLTRWAGGS